MRELADISVDYDTFLGALGYRFVDQNLLTLALAHRSWCAEHPGSESNERLEFLGDAVLDLAIADLLFGNEPDQREGSLAKARAEVVSETSLAGLARSLDLGGLVRLGKGEEQSRGRDKDSILADSLEAVIGAMYLDGGWKVARSVIQRLLAGAAMKAQVAPGERDYKTRLQEMASVLDMPIPSYTIHSSGPDHEPLFTAFVRIGSVEATGEGQSKKSAEQRAAKEAMDHLLSRTPTRQVAVCGNPGDAVAHGSGERTRDEG